MSNLIQIHMATAASAGFEQLGRSRALVSEAHHAARAQQAAGAAQAVVIRRAQRADVEAVAGLALMDGDRALREALVAATRDGEVLVAEVDGTVRAAVSLDAGRVVADPFAPSSAAAALLHVRARQLGAELHLRPRRLARFARRAA